MDFHRFGPRSILSLLLLIGAMSELAACSSSGTPGTPAVGSSSWRVYALEYGISDGMRRSTLIKGESPTVRERMSWMTWLLVSKEHGRTILVDTGFDDDELKKRWKFSYHRSVPRLLVEVGIEPSDITDVILTHLHWDHVGLLAPYKKARLWVQQGEYHKARELVGAEQPFRAGIRYLDIQQLAQAGREKRLSVIRGDFLIAPGVQVHLGGQHTAGLQWVEIDPGTPGAPAPKVALTSDLAYLYENIERHLPSGSSANTAADLEALARIKRLISEKRLMIPGHDPRVMGRFRKITEHIVEIR